MIRFKFLIVFMLLSGSISAWADSDVERVTYKAMINNNGLNIVHVKKGMKISEVVSLMKNYQSEVRNGILNNPWKIEYKGNTEIYHYLTHRHPPFMPILENQATPIIFVNGIVSGIGRNFLKDARENANSLESSTPESKKSVEERLKKLKDLYEKGIIDQQTYEDQKQRILDSI